MLWKICYVLEDRVVEKTSYFMKNTLRTFTWFCLTKFLKIVCLRDIDFCIFCIKKSATQTWLLTGNSKHSLFGKNARNLCADTLRPKLLLSHQIFEKFFLPIFCIFENFGVGLFHNINHVSKNIFIFPLQKITCKTDFSPIVINVTIKHFLALRIC